MTYSHVVPGIFLERPNRFIARCLINGAKETVHVKNTGRCRELLVPGATVYLEPAGITSGRKTSWDLIAVEKPGLGLVNIDSQAPNRAASEWLHRLPFTRIQPEFRFRSSRFDFYLEQQAERYLVEVKGCTLESGGTGFFPDAPTVRGTKHLKELAQAASEGWHCAVAFVIQMENVQEVKPNRITDPDFAGALDAAEHSGVAVLFLHCKVTPDSLTVTGAAATTREAARTFHTRLFPVY